MNRIDAPRDYFIITKNLQDLLRKVNSSLLNAQQQQNRTQHQKVTFQKFHISDTVFKVDRGRFKKKTDGPFTVVKTHGPVLCSIRRLNKENVPIFKVHVDRLIKVPSRSQDLHEKEQFCQQ